MKISIYILISLLSAPAIACRPDINGIKESMDTADNVHVGYVTGITNITFEASLNKERNTEFVVIPEFHRMRIFVEKMLKGERRNILNTNGPFCNVFYDIREKVYVFESKEREHPFALSEADFKSIYLELFDSLSNQ